MGVRRQPDGMSEANLQRFHLRRGVWKLIDVVVYKSLYHNELAIFRVGKTTTLKIAYYLISNDLHSTPKVSSCPEINHRRNHFFGESLTFNIIAGVIITLIIVTFIVVTGKK